MKIITRLSTIIRSNGEKNLSEQIDEIKIRYLCGMKIRPVNKPSFDAIFNNAIASAKIEGIRFDKKTEAHIKKEALKKVAVNSQ